MLLFWPHSHGLAVSYVEGSARVWFARIRIIAIAINEDSLDRLVGGCNLAGRSSLFRVFVSVASHCSSIAFKDEHWRAVWNIVFLVQIRFPLKPMFASWSACLFLLMPIWLLVHVKLTCFM